jgi:acyl-CoA reductase-like NAD-dependent aldehyde dehydrogenase
VNLDGTSLLVSFVVSGIGFVAFSYGRKMSRTPQVVVGLVMMVYPYFVPNLWAMGGIAAALLAGLFLAVRSGY